MKRFVSSLERLFRHDAEAEFERLIFTKSIRLEIPQLSHFQPGDVASHYHELYEQCVAIAMGLA